MRTLSSTLLAAQRSESRTPYVRVEARNDPLGVVNLVWERLYSGNEAEGRHALALAGDGSMLRGRVSDAGDNRKVYRQRVTSPGSGSDFSQWTYLDVYNVKNCAACALGSEVCLAWVKSSGEINLIKSSDNGATWGAMEYPGYAPSGSVSGMSAAYRPDGDLFLFFCDGSDLYLIRRLSGCWQTRIAWSKTTGALSGAAVVYNGDWQLLVSGLDTVGNACLWSLIYGDGCEVTAGSWGPLNVVQSSPAGSGYTFGPVYLDKPDYLRACCNEAYSGNAAYNRPLHLHAIPATVFMDNLWTEPKAFNLLNNYGQDMAHNASYAWLACNNGVWRAATGLTSLDLSEYVTALLHEAGLENGRAEIELQNGDGRYTTPGSGALGTLYNGGRIDISPGYRTAAGQEYSAGLSFILQGYEHISTGGKAALVLYAADGWDELRGWTARYPLRWNANVDEKSAKGILAFILGRAGLKLSVVSESNLIGSYYPDFTIQAGENGAAAVNRLLSYVPDQIFIEGGLACLVYPQATDSAVYAYGTGHSIKEGRYRQDSPAVNRVQVEGWDGGSGTPIAAETFDWTALEKSGDRLELLTDINLTTAGLARERGNTRLRKAQQAAAGGWISAAMNCGLQIMDALEITDSRTGLTAVRRRASGYTWSYRPAKGKYQQKIILGAV
jgi:hypothetical protein